MKVIVTLINHFNLFKIVEMLKNKLQPFLGIAGLMLQLVCMNIALLYACSSSGYFNVLDYGAISSINNDSSQAFLDAWKVVCNSEVDNPTLLVPRWKTFLVNPIVFIGPCNPDNINFQVLGEIVAPPLPSAWETHDPSQWLAFKEVSGLRLYGSGRVNGQGFGWWNQSCKYHPGMSGCTKLAPTALKFLQCNDTALSGIHFINSSQTHITLSGCDVFCIHDLLIEAPGNSPNTDGIHLQHAHNVIITNTIIGTGDDCISIGDYTSNIDIANITCGPGHGISIGSLGRGGSYVQVSNIVVKNVYLTGTTNGVRIKTWQEGRGYVRRVIFENIFFNSVKNPLIIDQHYGSINSVQLKGTKRSSHYFISGNKDKFIKNEKLVVMVLADRSSKNSPPSPSATPAAPAPIASDHEQQPPMASPPSGAGATLDPASPPIDDGTFQVPSAESYLPHNGM